MVKVMSSLLRIISCAVLLVLLPGLSIGQSVPIVEFDFFMEEVSEGVDSVVVEVIITEPDPAEVRAYIINEVSSNATIGTDFEMESPLELIFPPNSTESQFFAISITDDDLIEPLEMIMLAIESVVGGNAITGPEAEHVVAILDNDSCLVDILNTDTAACTDGSPILLEAIPTGGDFGGDGVIGNMFYPQLCDPGMASITYLMDQPGCNDSAQHVIEVEVCAGLWEYQQPEFLFYPNPAKDEFILEVPIDRTVRIINSIGKVVLSESTSGRSHIDCSTWHQGIYFVVVSDDTGNLSTSKRLVLTD